MEVLCNGNYIIRNLGTHKTQCLHGMRLRPFIPQDEIEGVQVNQKDLYLNANAVKDADNLDESLPFVPGEESDEETEEMDGINKGTEKLPFSDVYEPEVVTRRT